VIIGNWFCNNVIDIYSLTSSLSILRLEWMGPKVRPGANNKKIYKEKKIEKLKSKKIFFWILKVCFICRKKIKTFLNSFLYFVIVTYMPIYI
jgi:hypothetical protein